MASAGPGWSDLVQMGGTIALLVGGGLALGWFLDSRLVTSPLLTLIGVGLGVVSASFYMYSVGKKYWED